MDGVSIHFEDDGVDLLCAGDSEKSAVNCAAEDWWGFLHCKRLGLLCQNLVFQFLVVK